MVLRVNGTLQVDTPFLVKGHANIVEEYVLLNALFLIFVGLKRTWDQELSSGQMSRQLDLAITGLTLTFMTIHGGLPFLFRGP